ncbi:NADP-dependent oxidoreductase [Amycolatopsis sp. NPDC023774]|uniref:NADP-dependent oxidoreductase n=1 Tax=Amycolatopsis sp. NPDC023774 TaxID=3155015 RepID=UPI00340ACE65
MRAAVVRFVGGPDNVEVVDVAIPDPGLAQVRIKVQAAALNPVDAGVWSGVFGPPQAGDRLGLGWDVAGTIDATGPMSPIGLGTPVIAMVQGPVTAVGAQAEYVVVPANAVAPAPAGISAALASTIPLNGLTAAQSLELLAPRAGGIVMVTGAAGAVGGYAVELAKNLGLKVVALAGAGDEDFVTSTLGADWFVPRSDDPVSTVRQLFPDGVDGVLDAALLANDIMGVVRDGGSYVTVDPREDATPRPQRGITIRTTLAVPDGSRLTTLSDLVAAGRLTPRVAEIYPLSHASQAHRRLAQGGLRGRIVLTP